MVQAGDKARMAFARIPIRIFSFGMIAIVVLRCDNVPEERVMASSFSVMEVVKAFFVCGGLGVEVVEFSFGGVDASVFDNTAAILWVLVVPLCCDT